jgi:hypothetical protein
MPDFYVHQMCIVTSIGQHTATVSDSASKVSASLSVSNITLETAPSTEMQMVPRNLYCQ